VKTLDKWQNFHFFDDKIWRKKLWRSLSKRSELVKHKKNLSSSDKARRAKKKKWQKTISIRSNKKSEESLKNRI
jgi:predicted lipoprotein